ncbi:SDR family NAD(P)-dependent oxidoreductase [Brevibacterium sp.]|uniref:SDR family NAD(P)-dependent oxidoreductase n=1 Tax=Brevibacterium sp. TaxID=1701 RepID=UPI002811202B|nr:SDR family NAD(P)-dependent oxidoreductase [Brevibacterium sp.]
MTNRNAVVTGAGSGIGRGIVEAFLADGYTVWASDLSDDRLAETREALNNSEALRTRAVDVTDYAGLEGLADTVIGEGGSLDAWVNCAGIFDGYADVLETSPELWDKVLTINLTGSFYGARIAAARMTEQKSGRIITVGSVAGQRGAADGIAYAASKAGIEGMTRRLAVDVGHAGVTANVVAPGVIRTNLRATSEEILGDLVSSQQRGIGVSNPEFLDFLIPAKRSGLISEVAAVVVFLASDGAGYVNGQVLPVDGGWTAS